MQGATAPEARRAQPRARLANPRQVGAVTLRSGALLARLAHVTRAVLLALSLLAAVIVWIFAARPDWVDAFDTATIAAYTRDAEATLQRAQQADASRSVVEGALTPLLARLRGVRKGDRLAACKRAALARLAEVRLAAGDAAGAHAVTAVWRAFDALDLDAIAMAQRALAAQPGCEAEAAKLARELFDTAPDCTRFLEPHLLGCLARGDAAGVAAAFFAHLQAGGTPASADLTAAMETGSPVSSQDMTGRSPLRSSSLTAPGWTLWRDDGDGFDPVRVEALDVHGQGADLAVAFRPVFDCKRLRLALPPRVAARLHDARFKIATPAQVVEVPLRELARQTGAAVGEQGLHHEGDALVLEGRDAASLQWSLGPGARVDTTWTLLATVELIQPGWLGAVMRLTAVGERGRALLASTAIEDVPAQQRYLACRRASLRQARVGLQVGESAPQEVDLVPTADAGVAFAVAVTRGQAQRLRLTLPPVAAVDVSLQAPFALAARLSPVVGARVAGDVVRTTDAGAVLEFGLRAGDPATFTLTGTLR